MNLDLKFYRGLFLRRLPVMTALFLACVVASGLVAVKLPPTYSTSALLLVEEPQIPSDMAAILRTDPAQQLQVLERRLLTRANMLDIARKFEVFTDIRTMTPDAIVKTMRAQTSIRRTGGNSRTPTATLMTLEFEGRSARVVSNVVNEYVTLVLAESTENRMARAEGTLSFFEQETKRLSDDLDIQSARLVEFRNANSNALPDDLSYRQGRQTLLQERAARLERDIASAERQRREMLAVFEATGEVAAQEGEPQTREEQQLADLNFQLEQALAIYSESNPRVTLLRNRIAKLEKSIAQAGPNTEKTKDQEAAPVSMLDLTLAEIDQRVDNMRQELETVTAELMQLEASIAATAANAITLNALQRDYNNIQEQYNQAINSLNQARMSERIEVTAQGQRISVIEGANLPQQPSGPNKVLLVAGGSVAGLLLAAGFFFLLELLNRTIRRPLELEKKFNIMPLAVIPYIETRRERIIRRAVLIAAFTAVLILVPAGLYYIDSTYMPLEIMFVRVFDKLGLT